MDVKQNITLASLSKFWRWTKIPVLSRSKERSVSQSLVESTEIMTPGLNQIVQYLSGGNQQKVVLAKWLCSEAKIFIFDEPTRGIDVEAKASVHDLIRELTLQGVAVIMISSELPEIIGMSDRIIVMRDGTIGGELPAESSEAEIMLVATGQDNSNAAEPH